MSTRIFSWQLAHWTRVHCLWQLLAGFLLSSCIFRSWVILQSPLFGQLTQALHKRYILMSRIRVQRSEIGLYVRRCSEPYTRQYPKLGHDCFVIHFFPIYYLLIFLPLKVIYRIRQKKCIHTLTDGICVLFSKLNWISITICSMVFSQQMSLLAWL
jgi:hypothetical protein